MQSIKYFLCVIALALTVPASSSYAEPGAGETHRILINFNNPKPLNIWQTQPGYTYGSDSWTQPPQINRLVRAIEREYKIVEVDGWPVSSLKLYCVLFEVNKGADIDQLLQDINADRRVSFAEELQEFELMSDLFGAYSDPLVDVQYAENTRWLHALHQLSTGKNTRVGIIDSAIDRKHPDLVGQIRRQHSFLDTNLTSSPTHGTAVAGVIAASINNSEGIAGLVPDAQIYGYEACGERSKGTYCSSFTIAKALEHALEDNLDVLNISLAGPETPLLRALIDKLLEQGVILIAASNIDRQNHSFPANVPGVYAVGEPENPGFWVAKEEHLSTQAGGGYRFFYGTSMASAGVSGFAAMLRTLKPANEVRMILSTITDPDCNFIEAINQYSGQLYSVLESLSAGQCMPMMGEPVTENLNKSR